MTLPSKEANLQVLDLLTANWNSSNVSRTFKTAWISTGWWDDDTPNPQITLSTVSENTSPTSITAAGKGLSSWVDGQIQCDVWVPYDRDDMDSEGVAKDFRWDLSREAHRIIEANQDASQTTDLTRLQTGTLQRNPAESPPPYRILLPIGFQYRTAPP